MLRSLRIESFRCFQTFELQQLGRLNLLVGTNNSGKTSILEAIQILYAQNKFDGLRESLANESLTKMLENKKELDIKHLFYGHNIELGSKFSILGTRRDVDEKITFSIKENDQRDKFPNTGSLLLFIDYSGLERETIEVPLSISQSLSNIAIREIEEFKHQGNIKKTQFVTTYSLTNKDIIELFDRIVLTPEEEMVTESLQIIEPQVERIAAVGSGKELDGLVIRLAGDKQRLPLSSMGDGMRRILGLTLAIVNARDGILLVDEIDSGLHFSAMSKMWKLIWETAKRLNVQIFATTHSSDCWTSLAEIASTEDPSEEGITIHRIEKGKPSSIVFTDRQVVIAAEQGIEVR